MLEIILIIYYIILQGGIRIPCGVITYAGNHSATISYTNGSIIAELEFQVNNKFLIID